MKARVKATGEIVEIVQFLDNDKIPTTYDEDELDFFPNDNYWGKLRHQYAGMAMQGILSNYELYKQVIQQSQITTIAKGYATELVNKLKESKV